MGVGKGEASLSGGGGGGGLQPPYLSNCMKPVRITRYCSIAITNVT